jgi:hypothetical protein
MIEAALGRMSTAKSRSGGVAVLNLAKRPEDVRPRIALPESNLREKRKTTFPGSAPNQGLRAGEQSLNREML